MRALIVEPKGPPSSGTKRSPKKSSAQSKPSAMEEDEDDESEEEDIDEDDSEEEESEDDDDEEDDSIVEDDENEELDNAVLAENESNPLLNLSPEALDAEYDKRSAALDALKSSNRLTGGQYMFQQKCLDLEFRHLAELQELKAGKTARAKSSK